MARFEALLDEANKYWDDDKSPRPSQSIIRKPSKVVISKRLPGSHNIYRSDSIPAGDISPSESNSSEDTDVQSVSGRPHMLKVTSTAPSRSTDLPLTVPVRVFDTRRQERYRAGTVTAPPNTPNIERVKLPLTSPSIKRVNLPVITPEVKSRPAPVNVLVTPNTTKTPVVMDGRVHLIVDVHTFQEYTQANSKFVVLYGTEACPACRDLKPHYRDLATDYPRVTMTYVDIDAAGLPNFDVLPTLAFYHNGKHYKSIQGGVATRRLTEALDELARM